MPLRGDRSPAEERAEPASTIFSPVARDYPSRAPGGFFMPPCCDCSIKEQAKDAVVRSKSHGVVPPNLFTHEVPGFCISRGE